MPRLVRGIHGSAFASTFMSAPIDALPAARSAVPRLTNLCLGLSQLVCWGISFYMIGALGDPSLRPN